MVKESIGHILKLRMIISVLDMLLLFFFVNKVFEIGRINNLGIKKGMLIWLLIVAQVVLFVLLTESINKYSVPIQDIYHRKYIVNFGSIVSVHMGGVILLTCNPLPLQWYFVWCLFWFAVMLFVIYLHRSIRDDYLRRKEEIGNIIDKYSVKEDKLFLEKADAMKKSKKQCCVYMMIIGVFFEIFLNRFVAMFFGVINVFILWKMFKKSLEEYYQYQKIQKNIILVLGMDIAIICLVFGFAFAVYHEIIVIGGLEGYSAEDVIPIFMISFIPLLRHGGQCNRLAQRMRRKWII